MTENWFGGEGWSPIGNEGIRFIGSYNGQYYTIDRLYINRQNSSYIGLFGQTDGASISNLRVTNAYIRGSYRTGILAGSIDSNSLITNIYSAGEVYGSDSVGGLIGYCTNSGVENSVSYCEVYGESYVGGLMGITYYGSIISSYSLSSVSGRLHVGGLIGSIMSNSLVYNCFSVGSVTGEALIGGLIGPSSGTVTDSYWNTESSGLDNSWGGQGRTTAQMLQQSNYSSWDFTNTWTILQNVSYPALSWQDLSDYALPGPVNLTGLQENMVNHLDWEVPYNIPLGYRVYRNGVLMNEDELITVTSYTDSDLVQWEEESYYVTAAFEIDNTILESLKTNTISLTAIVVGGGNGTFENPYLIGAADHLYSARFVRRSHFLQANDIDLGAPPWNEGEGWEPIGNSEKNAFYGVYDGNDYQIEGLFINRPQANYQGLWGYLRTGEIRNVNLTGVFVSGNEYVGGLVGYTRENSLVSSSSIIGTVIGVVNNIGGLVGSNEGSTIEDSFSNIVISVIANKVGGLAGSNINSATIDNCLSNGIIQNSGTDTGGLVGLNTDSVIMNSKSLVNVTSTDESTGGLVGQSSSSAIINSCSYGIISGTRRVGGLVGENVDTTISKCYSSSRVSGTNYSTGGLIGRTGNSSIENSFSTGNVYSIHTWVGGLIGNSSGSTISNCYSTAFVTAYGNRVGGLIGFGEHQIVINSYWNIETSGLSSSSGGEGLTTEEMLQFSTFEGWNFADTWTGIEDFSYPALQWQEETSYPVPGPMDFTAIALDGVIHFYWQEPYSEPVGYNFYKNGLLMNEDTLITETEFTVNAENWDFNDYNVRAVIELQSALVESVSSEFLTVSAVQFAGGTGTAENPYMLENGYQLYNITFARESHFRQSGDINLGIPPWNQGEGWIVIGYDLTNSFFGSFDGNDYSIDGLYINRPSAERQGLFGYIYEAEIKNVNLTNVYVSANSYSGGLCGYVRDSVIENSSVNGTIISAGNYTGGLAGYTSQSLVKNCSAVTDVAGINFVGGLIGSNRFSSIELSHSTGEVNGNSRVGGLAGDNRTDSYIYKSYSSSCVAGNFFVGGLVGENITSIIFASHSLGNVSGLDDIGGLTGSNNVGVVSHSYSFSSVTGNTRVGGLVGQNPHVHNSHSVIRNSFSTGSVTGGQISGGLIGLNSPNSIIENSYWDMETSGKSSSFGGEGRTTAEMTYPHGENTYVGWDFTNVWAEDQDHSENNGYPYIIVDIAALFAGGNGSYTNPYIISSAENLSNIRYVCGGANSEKHFIQVADIDLSETYWNSGEGWLPIGENSVNSFWGSYEGNGFVIEGLFIDRTYKNYQSLFGWVENAKIANIGLSNVNISGSEYTGSLIGYGHQAYIANCYSTGAVNGLARVGGLAGAVLRTVIENSYNTASVSGGFATGGFIGRSSGYSEINNCYNIGLVIGSGAHAGGLIGDNHYQSLIRNSYWDIETSGLDASAAGEGRTTAEMTFPYASNTYVGWDFIGVWAEDTDHSVNNGYPYLLQTDLSIEAEDNHIPLIKKITLSNYPNPFNPETVIVFHLPQDVEKLELAIYNIKGQLVRTLIQSYSYAKGEHSIIWDSRNNHGKSVTSGVYFYRLTTPSHTIINKMMLLK